MDGFTEIGRIYVSESYEWSVLAVWVRDSDNALLWATDAGCSCNDAFDSPPDLVPVDSGFALEGREWLRTADGWRSVTNSLASQFEQLLRRIAGVRAGAPWLEDYRAALREEALAGERWRAWGDQPAQRAKLQADLVAAQARVRSLEDST